MPDTHEYSAFTTTPDGGNPAGVVLDASTMAEEEMLATAARLGHSESAFAIPLDGDRRYRVRYFSPLAEVAFCGHATIAAAAALADVTGTGELVFETGAGEVRVDTAKDAEGRTTATLTSPVPGPLGDLDGPLLDELLAALRWSRDDLDPRYPPRVAHGGMFHPVLAVRTRGRLADLDYDFEALGALMAREDWITVQLVWAERDDRFYARDPFPPGGIVEDPATGAAAAAFGAYLRALDLLPASRRFTVLQGVDLGRPSRLDVEVPEEGGVRVGGPAVRMG